MSEMVERVAKAIYESHRFVRPWDHPNTVKLWHRSCRASARAAIEAMREPTDEMMKAGWIAQYSSIGASDEEARQMANGKILLEHEKNFLRAGWSAAIDAALQD